MKAFLQDSYPNLDIGCELIALSNEDKNVIASDYDIYFRFLSLLSGKPTPYNIEYGHYRVKNKDWIWHDDNMNLVEWYKEHQDMIGCDVFNEYYGIEKGIREGPRFRVDDFDEYLRKSEEYFDSIFDMKEKFDAKYSNFLLKDSIW